MDGAQIISLAAKSSIFALKDAEIEKEVAVSIVETRCPSFMLLQTTIETTVFYAPIPVPEVSSTPKVTPLDLTPLQITKPPSETHEKKPELIDVLDYDKEVQDYLNLHPDRSDWFSESSCLKMFDPETDSPTEDQLEYLR